MSESNQISFGDNVRIKQCSLTEQIDVAGLIGNVTGETRPSVTSVKVIGELKNDFAFYVLFDELNKGYWFTPELLEFIDHAPGTEITLKGVPKKWTRSESGEWVETNTEELKGKPWWKFW